MTLKKLSQMLKDEIKASMQFEQSNKGLRVGSDFDEVTKDILHSDTVCSILVAGATLAFQQGPGPLVKSMLSSNGQPGCGEDIILNNKPIFVSPLQMFYWGMQVGRKLQKEEIDLLASITVQNSPEI